MQRGTGWKSKTTDVGKALGKSSKGAKGLLTVYREDYVDAPQIHKGTYL